MDASRDQVTGEPRALPAGVDYEALIRGYGDEGVSAILTGLEQHLDFIVISEERHEQLR